MKKGLTQAEKQEKFIQDVKKQFCDKFGWTEEYYCQKEFKKAFLWLEFYSLPESFTYSKTFWNWWKITNAMIHEKSILSGELQQVYFKDIRPYSTTLKQMNDESLASIT